MYTGTVSRRGPTTETVAPVSPTERVKAMIDPARIAGRMDGKVTRVKAWTGFAPSVRAVSSRAGSSCSSAPTTFRTTKGT